MFENGFSVCCCWVVYLAVMITSLVLFSQSYGSVEVGTMALLQNKFSKKFDPEVYYSGRYFTGLAKTYISYPLQFQSLIFSNLNDSKADSGAITSTTSSGSIITVSINLQYYLRPEKLLDIYLKWPVTDRLKNDLKLSVRQAVSSTTNLYRPIDFREKRAEIEAKMSNSVGNILKNNFFSDLKQFAISQVILEAKDVQGYLDALITSKQQLQTQQVGLVNQKKSEIDTVKANATAVVANIRSLSVAEVQTERGTRIATIDSKFADDIQASSLLLRTKLSTTYSGGLAPADLSIAYANFQIWVSNMNSRNAGTFVLGFS